MQNERRQHQPRIPASISAKILVDGHAYPIDCRVQNASPAGARLVAENCGITVARSLRLRLEGRLQVHYCSVKWQKGDWLGVAFQRDHAIHWWTSFTAHD